MKNLKKLLRFVEKLLNTNNAVENDFLCTKTVEKVTKMIDKLLDSLESS